MKRPISYTPSGAKSFADSLWNLYSELERKFGGDFAREFMISFYHGAGRDANG